MKIYDVVSSKQVGEVNSDGVISTTNEALKRIVAGGIVAFDYPASSNMGLKDNVEIVEEGDPNFIFALSNSLERNGFVIV